MKRKVLIAYANYQEVFKVIANGLYNCFISYDNDFEIRLINILDYTNQLGDLSIDLERKKDEFLRQDEFSKIYELFSNRIKNIPYKFMVRCLFSKELEDYIIDFKPDVFLSTHYFSSIIMEVINQKYNTNTKIVTIIDDYQTNEMWLKTKNKNENNIYIVDNEIVKYQLIKDGIKSNQIYAYGVPFTNEIKNNIRNKNEIKEIYNIFNNKPIYLFYIYSDNGDSSYDYLKKLLELKLDVNIFFVCEDNQKIKNRVEYLINSKEFQNVIILESVSNLSNLIYIANLVITQSNNLILMEVLTHRKCSLLINCNSKEEVYNTKFIKKNKFGLYCKNPIKLKKIVKKIYKNSNIIKKYENNMLNYNDNYSISKIYNLIIDLLKEKGS